MKYNLLAILLASLVAALGCAKSNDGAPNEARQGATQSAAPESEPPQAHNNDRNAPPVVRSLVQRVLACQNFTDTNPNRNNLVPYTVDPEGNDGVTWRGILAPYMGGVPGFPGCAAIVDKDGIFTPSETPREPNEGIALEDCKDGLSNIVAFVELDDPESERSCISERRFFEQLQNCPEDKEGYFVVMFSGEVYLLDKSTTREQLHALVTIKGGEKTPAGILK